MTEQKVMTVENAVSYLWRLIVEGKGAEPVFILRGQDKLAVQTVLYWVYLAEKSGVKFHKVTGAWAHAEAMAGWTPRKLPD